MPVLNDQGQSKRLRGSLFFFLVLFLVLAALFNKSFQAGYVHFANDLPLGARSAEPAQLPGAFKGWWLDLNWIGIEVPLAPLNFSSLLRLVTSPILFMKLELPVALFLLGISAWYFFRQNGFHPAVAALGGLAAALNSHYLSNGAWGLSIWIVMAAMIFFALGLVTRTDSSRFWIRLVLAGFFVGLGVTEGFDSGAILSLFVAAYVLFLAFQDTGTTGGKLARGTMRVGVVALFAGAIAAQTILTLVTSQIQGVVGMAQDEASREQRWAEATQWSLPKAETSRVIIPGLYGYRMDTEDGGNYWGRVGEREGYPNMRFSGSGEYAGIVVVLVALFAIGQTLKKQGGAFTPIERRYVIFWTAAALIGLVLSWGRFAPFYRIVYALPYFSTFRNPIKWMHGFHLAVIVLFGFGLQALWRLYLDKAVKRSVGWGEAVSKVWKNPSPEKRWALFYGTLVAVALLGYLAYSGSKPSMLSHLAKAGFSEEQARTMLKFSIQEVLVFLGFMAATVFCIVLVLGGAFQGARARWAFVILGCLLTLDLARANIPWVRYEHAPTKYAQNPIIDFLKENTLHQRVTFRSYPEKGNNFNNQQAEWWPGVCNVWLEHHMQYYGIRTLDIIQMPRRPFLDDQMLLSFFPAKVDPANSSRTINDYPLVTRLWELTGTRYIVGMAGFHTFLQEQFDPVQKRFQVHSRYQMRPKVSQPSSESDIGWQENPAGPFAIFEFTGALPRVALFSNWETVPNDEALMAKLKDPGFNPATAVLLTNSIPAPTAPSKPFQPLKFDTCSSRRITLKTNVDFPSMLLLNDRWHPSWKAKVDGKEQEVLRVNYLMRGLQLPAGSHEIVFEYHPPLKGFWVSAVSVLAALGCILLLIMPRKKIDAPGNV